MCSLVRSGSALTSQGEHFSRPSSTGPPSSGAANATPRVLSQVSNQLLRAILFLCPLLCLEMEPCGQYQGDDVEWAFAC